MFAGHVVGKGEKKNAFKNKTQGQGPLWRPTHKREDNIKTNIGKIIYG
jgi:hypothetical protein